VRSQQGSDPLTTEEVMPALVEACPSFEATWESSLARSARRGEEAGPYDGIDEFAGHLVELLADGQTEEFEAVFAVVERFLVQGDDAAWEVVAIGFIEDLQAAASGGVPDADGGWDLAVRFRPWLGIETGRQWDELHRASPNYDPSGPAGPGASLAGPRCSNKLARGR
jgi:hypothetical protein